MFSSNSSQVSSAAVFVEDVFSTYLYTGTGASQTITNGIDLSTKGGLVWIKDRSNAESHSLWDTARGVSAGLQSNATSAQYSDAISLTAYNSNGFSLGADTNVGWVNRSPDNYVSWTFREQPKFFDVVTYTGNGANNRAIAHNLGSAPGCVIVKSTSSANNWPVFHRSTGANTIFWLNATNANSANVNYFPTAPDATSFYVGTDTDVNQSGYTYVAYLFAHDAGGFGLAGTDNVISCGTFTTDGSGLATVSLGYEPQWVMVKRTDSAGNWIMHDIMRGYTADVTSGTDAFLRANTSAAEVNTAAYGGPNATGFTAYYNPSETCIYIAIRRGPMKVPTLGTSVFEPIIYTGTGAGTPPTLTTNFPVDMTMFRDLRTGSVSAIAGLNTTVFDRLRGNKNQLSTSSTAAEDTTWGNAYLKFDSNTQMVLGTDTSYLNALNANYVNHSFRRAPSFFDEVCYTGTGADLTLSHNLQAVPQMIICKARSTTSDWGVYQAYSYNGFYGGIDLAFPLNGTSNYTTLGAWLATPTSSVFYLASSTYSTVNDSGQTYVAYLFSTCAGVSKVGSYTGTGALQTINCGFTSGARFVLIRRTDGTGNWWTYDSARGISSGNDPYLFLNSTAAEVTNTDYVDTDTTGFKVTAAAPAGLNANGGIYIFLAIA